MTGRALNRYNAWAAIRKRAKAAGFLTPVGCHTWRATGITIYLENDGRLEHAQQMAGHESPRTTNNETLRPNKGRDYTERGRTHPVVKFVSERHCEAVNARFDAPLIILSNSKAWIPGVP